MTEIVCKKCKCDEVRRVRRRGPIEHWIYPMMSIYPFVCGKCARRFIAIVHRDEPDQIPLRRPVSGVTNSIP
jgi:hypothetical protein